MPAGHPQAQNHPATWDSVKPRTQDVWISEPEPFPKPSLTPRRGDTDFWQQHGAVMEAPAVGPPCVPAPVQILEAW